MFSKRGRLKVLIVMGILLFACRLAFRLCAGSIPITTLPVQHLPQPEAQKLADIVWDEYFAFSARQYSPDGKYIVVPDNFKCILFHHTVVWMVEAETGKRIGFYSFRNIIGGLWTEDGRGFYVVDYIPGEMLLWFIGPNVGGYLGPAKVVLVPCQAPLTGVPLLPRLYWEIRCLFPDPHSLPAVWIPLVLLMAGLGAAGWSILRWLCSSQGRSVMSRLARMVLEIPRRIEDWLLGI